MIDNTKLYKSVIIVILPYEFRKSEDRVYHVEEVRLLPRMVIDIFLGNELRSKKVLDLLDNDVILLNDTKYIVLSKI